MKFLLILLGLSLSTPAFSEDNINPSNNDALTISDSNTYEITFTDKSDKDAEALAINYFYNFGRTRVFTTKSINVTLRNRRVIPIVINNIGIRGNGFFERENCPQFLFFGQGCTVRVFFRPNHIGNFNGALSINLTGAEDIHVFLSGRGVFGVF